MATYYIDPNWTGAKSGTFAAPFSTYISVTNPQPGDKILQKAGTTFNGHTQPPTGKSGTAGNPITYGVYDPITGLQVISLGAATMAGTGSASHVFFTGGESFIEIVGFRLKTITSSAAGIRLGSNSSGATDGNAARYCIADFETCYAGCIVYTNTGLYGHTVDNCVFNNNSLFGIALEGTATNLKVTITNTTCNYNARSGIRNAFGGPINLSGLIAYNTCNFNGVNQATQPYGVGIDLISNKADLHIFKNTCNNNYINGMILGNYTGASTTNQFLAQGNTCLYNGEMGITVSTGGGWLLIRNTCNFNGSNRGFKYGRGIEIYGGAVKPPGPGIVCFNECSYNYNYGGTQLPSGNGTEGVGIGLDDGHKDITVFGNLCVANEGNGISVNPANASGTSRIFGNLLIDNFAAPLSRAAAWPDYVKAQLCSYTTENNLKIYNNTFILTAANAPACLYGISENDIATGTANVMCNNLLKGHTVAMKVRTGIARTNNGFFGNGKNVENNTNTTTLSDGTGAVTVDPKLDAAYRPGATEYKRAGVFFGGKDYYGKNFYNTPTIGAVEDHATPAWQSVVRPV